MIKEAAVSPLTELDELGWTLRPNAISPSLIDKLNCELEEAYCVCRDIQERNGVAINTDGTVHHAVVAGGSFFDLLDRHLDIETMESYFEGKFILNSFGGVINMRNKASYVCNVHRDIRSFSGKLPLMLNMLLMLDDFTIANGATYLLSGSHMRPDRPSEASFFERADRAVGKAGTVLLFNSNLWHAAGRNETDTIRRALTLTFTRPFMKQQLDYPRCIGYDRAADFSENLKQVLGYNSRIPTSLDEWYQPPEKRLYRPGQG